LVSNDLLKKKHGMEIVMASLVAFLFLVPFLTRDRYLLHILILSNVMAILAVSWNLVAGYLGQLNLAHAIFYGLGAYASGYAFKLFRLPPLIGIFASGVVAIIAALVVGIPCFRLKGHYFAIATLASSQIFYAATGALSKITGGEEGISGIEPLLKSLIANYYLFLILMIATVFTIYMILRSRLGLIIRSVREDELLSEASGLDTMKYKILALCISAFIAGIIGSVNCYYQSIVTPDTLSISLTFGIVAMVIVGGFGTLVGPVIGAYLLTFIAEYLYFILQFRLIIFSLLIIFIILFSPKGFLDLIVRGMESIFGPKMEAAKMELGEDDVSES